MNSGRSGPRRQSLLQQMPTYSSSIRASVGGGFHRWKGVPRVSPAWRIKDGPLPGFYIGAQAAVQGMKILTRNPKLYTSYFPTLKIIEP